MRLARLTGRPYQSPPRVSAGPRPRPRAGPESRRPRSSLRLHERQRGVQQRRRLGRDEHGGVADHLDELDRPLGDLGGQLAEPVDDAAEALRRQLLAEPGEPDEVGEADRDLAAGRSGARSTARREVDRVVADRVAQVVVEARTRSRGR